MKKVNNFNRGTMKPIASDQLFYFRVEKIESLINDLKERQIEIFMTEDMMIELVEELCSLFQDYSYSYGFYGDFFHISSYKRFCFTEDQYTTTYASGHVWNKEVKEFKMLPKISKRYLKKRLLLR